MHKRFSAVCGPMAIAGLALLACTANMPAQSFPFQLVIQQGSVTQAVSNGGTANIASDAVNKPVQLTLNITNASGNSATLSAPQLLGAAQFTITASGSASLLPGQSTAYSIVFTPTGYTQVSALLTIGYTQPPTTAGGASTSGFITLGLAGTAPNFVLSYLAPPTSNAVGVSDGGTIQFPTTTVGATTTVILDITNNGTAAGTLDALAVTGATFQTQSLPLLPGNIASGATLQVMLQYKPGSAETDTGTVQITFPDQTVTLKLQGSGVTSALKYQLTQAGQTTTVSPNQIISLADTNSGSTTQAILTITNSGNADATINAIQLTGSGFGLIDAPPVPITIGQGATTSLTFAFTPPQAGSFTGHLRIGSDSFTLSAKGLGTLFQYSYSPGTGSNTVVPGGSIFFTPVAVGQSSAASVTVTNGGTIAGTISSIAVGEANSPFVLSNLPGLPLTLAAGQSVTFNVTFTPATVATVAGTLHIDAATFALSGVGQTPPALPSYSFTGASGNQTPLQQPSIGLSLASGYPLAITGTLTLTVSPDGFAADPAIQFSTGGRTVAFTIAANSTAAVFANGNTSIKLQTGSTSGTITLSPTFQTTGGATLTPANPLTLQLTVPRAVPALIQGALTASSNTSLTVAITGVSDSQVLTKLDFTFVPKANFNLATSTVSVSTAALASSWFQSTAAQAFGGQFLITIPFNLSSDSTSLTAPATAIQSIMVTATNDQGTSSPVTINLQ